MTHEILDEQTELQLKVIGEMSAISETLGIEFWLRGGWAIDFLLGKITRTHDDIDIVTLIENRERLENELLKAGYEQVPVKEQFRNRQSDFQKGSVEITYSYLTLNVNRDLIMNELPEWVWRADSLLQHNFQLQGLTAKVIHPKQLLEEKETYEQIGRPYRQKDAESKKVLHHIITHFNKVISNGKLHRFYS
jgi:hypothetical protein